MSDSNEKRPRKRQRKSDGSQEGAEAVFQSTWDLTPTSEEPLPDFSAKIPSPLSELAPPEFDSSFTITQPDVFLTPEMGTTSELFNAEDCAMDKEDRPGDLLSSGILDEIHSQPGCSFDQSEISVSHDIPFMSDLRLTSEQSFIDEQVDSSCSFPDSSVELPPLHQDDKLTVDYYHINVETDQAEFSSEPPDEESISAASTRIPLPDTLNSLHDTNLLETNCADNTSASADFDNFFDATDDGNTREFLLEDCPPDAWNNEPFSEEECRQEEDAFEDCREDEPLYPGAKVTVSECSIAFLSLMLGCNISGQLLSTILSFILLILPEGSKFFSSLHLFLNQYKHLKAPVNFIFYCSKCFRSLLSKDCVCPRCGPDGTVAYYLNFPIIPQIQALYSNSQFVEALSYRFNRSKMVETNLEDIYDGKLYKSASHILNQPYNTSLMWNTDGISIYKSSNFQIYPFYFVFNELPPHLRYREEYMILGGLAFGNEKPNCNIFLKPISDECEILKAGIAVTLPNAEFPITVKTIVLCGTCDALAKSLFFRMNNFNGFHGCPRCLANGQKSDLSENVFVYPYQENFVERTAETYRQHLQAVKDKGDGGKEPVFGVKGPSYLFRIVYTFFLTSTAIDVMHNVYLGCCRQMFFLWVSTPFLKKVFGDNAERKSLIETLSTILVNMKSPHYFSRPPRSLHNVKYFKAAEFRIWLFGTALPLLEKYMKEPYLTHFMKLVCSISLLNQASVSLQDVDIARGLLDEFVREFQELYGVRNMSFNVHCLQHLSDNVLQFGPLFVSSCFGFESLNGRLARLVHGTRHAGLQIYSHIGLLRNLAPLVTSLKNASVKLFCKRTIYKAHHLKVAAKLEPGISVIGNVVKEHVLPPDFSRILCENSDISANLSFFYRLKKYSYLYVAEDYGRGERNSACVQFKSNDQILYGSVKVFVKTSHCICPEVCDHVGVYHALIQQYECNIPFHVSNPPVPILSILSVTTTPIITMVPVQDLQCVCFEFSVNSSMFLTVPLNSFELE